MPRIYTRSGDKGDTFCYALGGRVPKYHLVMELLGTIDEANSAIGLARAACGMLRDSGIPLFLRRAQEILFLVGFSVSGAKELEGGEVEELEKWVDRLMEGIELKGFILPAGGECASRIHLARAIVRRAERLFFKARDEGLLSKGDAIDEAGRVLNRLSDALFAAAVRAAHEGPGLEYVKP